LKSAIAKEVKEEILTKIKGGEKVVAVAQQYGISEKTIYYWLRVKAVGTVSLLEYNRLRKENQQLKEILGILTFELEKSKKKKAC
jgi:transposase-like protein